MVRDSWDSWEGCLKLLKEKQKIKEMQKNNSKKVFDPTNYPNPPYLYL